MDALFLTMDVADIVSNPADPTGYICLVADGACAFCPFLTGGRLAVKGVEAVVDAGRTANKLVESVKSGERIVDSYKDLTKITKGTGLQAHHLLEGRFAESLGLDKGQMIAVALTKEQHQVYTNRWREFIKYGQDYSKYTMDQLLETAKKVYSDAPDLYKALEDWAKTIE